MASRQSFTATGTAAAVGELRNMRRAKLGAVVISGLATETITITSRINSVTALGPPHITSAGAAAASTTLGNGTYFLRDLGVDALIFTKSAGVDNVTINAVVFE